MRPLLAPHGPSRWCPCILTRRPLPVVDTAIFIDIAEPRARACTHLYATQHIDRLHDAELDSEVRSSALNSGDLQRRGVAEHRKKQPVVDHNQVAR